MSITAVKPFTVRRWTKATFWGWILGVMLILILSSFLDSIGIEHMQFYLGVGIGAGTGFVQSLLLKKYAPIDFKWMLSSIAGMGAPFIFLDFIPSDTIPHKLPLSIALGGLTVGFLQYVLLINNSRKAYLWIPGCFLGWTLGVLTVFTIDYTKYLALNNLITAFINLLLILAGGVVLGVISGIALKKILE